MVISGSDSSTRIDDDASGDDINPVSMPQSHCTPSLPTDLPFVTEGATSTSFPAPRLTADRQMTGQEFIPTSDNGATSAAPPPLMALAEWVGSLGGQMVDIPAHGQCLFIAVYASTALATRSKFTPTASQLVTINLMKAQVVDIVLSNLRYDVQLHLVDAAAEPARLYPPLLRTLKGATAALYTHHAGMRNRSVAHAIPQDFWGSALFLRALAVYLREPVYVWDVDADGMAHAQQYPYQNHTLTNGATHETGVV